MDSINSLPVISKKGDLEYVPKEFKEVASSMEKQFIQHMLEQMEKSTGAPAESSANSYYKSLQRNERSEIISNLSEEGSLKHLILEQIYPKKFRNKVSFDAYLKTQNNSKHNQNKGSL